MTVLYCLGNVLTFKAFKITEASEVSIIFASSTAWAVVSAVVFLGERLSLQNVIGIGLIVTGLVAINLTKSKWRFQRGHVYALLAAACFGLAFTNDAYIIGQYQSIASYMVLAFLLPGLSILLFFPKSGHHLRHFASVGTIFKVVSCGLFYAISALTIFTAYKVGGQASIISPIQQMGMIFTVILSYILLKERDKLPQKIIGTILSFLGVLLLV